jgi:hypothetical protein
LYLSLETGVRIEGLPVLKLPCFRTIRVIIRVLTQRRIELHLHKGVIRHQKALDLLTHTEDYMAFPLSITFNNYEHTRKEVVIVVSSEGTACCAFTSLISSSCTSFFMVCIYNSRTQWACCFRALYEHF